MTVKDLKNALRERSLPLSGSKEQIIDRLIENDKTKKTIISSEINVIMDLGSKILEVNVEEKMSKNIPRSKKFRKKMRIV